MYRLAALIVALGVALALTVGKAAEPSSEQPKAGAKSEKAKVDEKRPDKPLCCFTAKVKWVKLEGDWEGKVVPIGRHIDMHWLVCLDILSIEKPGKAFEKKGERVLIVHSPTLFFGQPGDEVVGKQFSFKVFGDMKGDGLYTYAEVVEQKNAEKNQKKSSDAKKKNAEDKTP